MSILIRICTTLSCGVGDIIEFINENKNENIYDVNDFTVHFVNCFN